MEPGKNWNVDIGGMPLWKKLLWLVAAALVGLAGGGVCVNCF